METVVAISVLPLFLGWRLVLMIFCMSTSHQLDVQIHFSNLRHLDGCRSRRTTGKRCASQCLRAGKQDGIPSQPLGIGVINLNCKCVGSWCCENESWKTTLLLVDVRRFFFRKFVYRIHKFTKPGSQITSSFSVRKNSLREKAASRLTSRDFFHGLSHVLQRFSWRLIQKVLFYMILAVEKSASQSDIKKAYRTRTPWNIIQVWGRWSREIQEDEPSLWGIERSSRKKTSFQAKAKTGARRGRDGKVRDLHSTAGTVDRWSGTLPSRLPSASSWDAREQTQCKQGLSVCTASAPIQ